MNPDRIKQILADLHSKGILLPTIRDPRTGVGSISLTMMFISFNMVFVGLIGKWSKALGEIDTQQAIYWFMVCAGLYFGRKISGDGKKADINEKVE